MNQAGTSAMAAAGTAPIALMDTLNRWVAKRRIVLLINSLVLLVLTASLAHWTWLLLKPPALPAPPTRTDLSAKTSIDRYDLQTVLHAHLFGQATLVQPSIEKIPISSLNLVLTGVVVTNAGSYALISVENAPEAPFAIGEEVIASVTLQAVYPDRAILLRAGSTESLMLQDEASNLPPGALISYTPAGSEGRNGVRALSKNSFSVDREMINQHMQTPAFLSDVMMVPNAGGGFLVREIQSGGLYEKLGLKVGDVIRTVNGQTVNTIDDVMRLYQQMGGAEHITHLELSVVRAGKQESLRYDLH